MNDDSIDFLLQGLEDLRRAKQHLADCQALHGESAGWACVREQQAVDQARADARVWLDIIIRDEVQGLLEDYGLLRPGED